MEGKKSTFANFFDILYQILLYPMTDWLNITAFDKAWTSITLTGNVMWQCSATSYISFSLHMIKWFTTNNIVYVEYYFQTYINCFEAKSCQQKIGLCNLTSYWLLNKLPLTVLSRNEKIYTYPGKSKLLNW